MSLNISELKVSLGGKQILNNVSLEIQTGEFFSLLGSSGCGKTTLLKTMAGLVQEDSGDIQLEGESICSKPPQKRGMVVMFQDKRLFTNMNVAENVAFSLRNKGIKKAQRAQVAEKYLDMVQLPNYGERRVHELSGGQQQRVALARALAAEPKVLLLDEPFSALDENLRDDMRNLVKSIHDSMGITTVMVTHDQHEALSLSDRIAVMDSGRIEQVGTPREVYEQPASLEIALYFADGDTLKGEIKDGRFTAGEISFKTTAASGSALAIVRKDIVSIDENGEEFEVESVRYQGSEIALSLIKGDFNLRLSAPKDAGINVGQTIRVKVDWDRALVFPC